jgi:hypothetical protein
VASAAWSRGRPLTALRLATSSSIFTDLHRTLAGVPSYLNGRLTQTLGFHREHTSLGPRA